MTGDTRARTAFHALKMAALMTPIRNVGPPMLSALMMRNTLSARRALKAQPRAHLLYSKLMPATPSRGREHSTAHTTHTKQNGGLGGEQPRVHQRVARADVAVKTDEDERVEGRVETQEYNEGVDVAVEHVEDRRAARGDVH